MMQTQSVCPQCNGEGKIIKNKCKHCSGEGIVYGEDTLLGACHTTTTVTGGTCFRTSVSFGAGSMAMFTGDIFLQFEFLVGTVQDFFQAKAYFYAQVRTSEPALALLSASTESAETAKTSTSAEHIAEHREYVIHGGKGNAGKRNGVPGDLLIQIEEEPNQELIRQEDDLIYNLLLSFPKAALGDTVEIPTIDGKVKVKIDPGTQPGKVLRLRGKGLPNVNGYGTGDLLVNISVYIPETLSKDEKNAIEKMRNSDNFSPNPSIKEKIFRKFKSYFE